MGVIIGFYVKRISEGMGTDGISIGSSILGYSAGIKAE